MSAVDFSVPYSSAIILHNMLMTVESPANALAREEVREKIRAEEKRLKVEDEERDPKDKIPQDKWRQKLSLTREHLGAIKLALIGLWSFPGKNGQGAASDGDRVNIRKIAEDFRIWKKSVLPALPKDDAEPIAELDDEAEITDLDPESSDHKE